MFVIWIRDFNQQLSQLLWAFEANSILLAKRPPVELAGLNVKLYYLPVGVCIAVSSSSYKKY